MKLAENQRKKSVFNIVNILSPSIIKNFEIGSENLPIFLTLHVQIGRILKKTKFSNFDFRAFDILSLKSIKKWPRNLIFIEIQQQNFEKPAIFAGFCHVI